MASPASTATIGSIADKIACGANSNANTGKRGCLSLFGTPEHLILLTKGTIVPTSTVFNLEYIKALVQNGKAIPLMFASAFEDVSAEDTYSTNSAGIKRLNLKGLPEYKLMFEEGHEFYKQLHKLEGYKSFDFVVGDDEGNWMFAERSDGSFQGFTGGHTTPELTKRKVAGGDAESKSFLFQFLDRRQVDVDYAIIHQGQLDFVPNELPLINGVNIDFTESPASGSVEVKFSVVLSGDNNTKITAISSTDIRYSVDGVEEVPTAISQSGEGVYVITVDPLVQGKSITVAMADANDLVADIEGVLYRGSNSVEVS